MAMMEPNGPAPRCFQVSDLSEDLWGYVRLGVEEVQHVARVLDAVLGRLLRGGEPVVPGAVEVLEAAGAVLQLVALTGDDSRLLGDAAGGRDGSRRRQKAHHVRLWHRER